MTVDEQQQHMESGHAWRDGMLFPLHCVWPMGFSWSSYIAQEEMLSVCQDSGIQTSSLLACDCVTPSSFELVAAVATDDVMFFSDAGPGATSTAARAFDAAMDARRAVRNPKKDEDDELCGTCVGVDLVDGYFLDVPGGRYLAMILTFLHMHRCKVGSPRQVQQLLGVLQWFDLLVRPKLSVYSAIYDFTISDSPDSVPLPKKVLGELACSLCLGIFWRCDLRRRFLPMLGATDASSSYGLGASVVHASEEMVRTVARWAEKQGAFVVMDGDAARSLSADRMLEARYLNLKLEQFSDVFSVRSKFSAHINVLEGEAFVLFLKWLLRSTRHHSTRVVVLLDSAVFLGAAAKGRSSSQLNRLLRKAASLTMAGNLQLHLVFVPSSENPADYPSRGKRKRSRK
ncbi:PDE9A [Symbiodinium pilosum]|uniref:PDE9A protein n=1 Tax=Symbiodinium pilosum TaxID=2952 RepID=A0A812PVI5_SYMPI|nr:PDE9A [Symbiodinium pilosum]